MKKLIEMIILVQFSWTIQNHQLPQLHPTINFEEVLYAVSDEHGLWNEEGYIFVMKEYSKESKDYFKISILHESDFPSYSEGKSDKAIGFFKFYNKSVLVFTNKKQSDFFLRKGDDYTEFSFLRKNSQSKKDSSKIEINFFEPIIWEYKLSDYSDSLVFIDKGFLLFLE
ncbi:hypothetical protein [Algivirga pacifica]|uniref:hypothetical protein n=1 Tax=Algivirga pacifica TaxID=1162670 RepID=UPI0031EF4C26